MTRSFRSRDLPLALLGLLVCASAYGPVVERLVAQWRTDGNYSHGFLVVPFAMYFAWQRRKALGSAEPGEGTIAGLGLILASALLFVAGQFGAELFLTRVSLVGMLAGIVGFVWGRNHLRLLAFPLSFLLFMIPLPAIVFNQITMPLQSVASSLGETLIRAAGIPVLRDGNVLQLATGNLEVVDACSGIRSLVTLTMVGVLIGYRHGGGPRRTVLAAGAAIPVAIVTNAVRVAGTGLASSWIGPDAAEGFFHTFTGFVLFGTALAVLLAVPPLLARAADAQRGISGWLRSAV